MKKLATFFGLLKVHRFITLLFTGLAFSTGAFAASVTFNGTTNTDWATPTNWSSGTVPTSGDVIIIAASKSVEIAIATIVSVERITLNAGAGLTNYGTLTIAPVSTTGAALNISGSNTFDNEGTLTVTTVNQTSGTNAISLAGTGNTLTFNGTSTLAAISTANVFSVAANATATIAGAGFTIGNVNTYVNFTTFSMSTAGATITINNGTTLNLYTGKNSFSLNNSASVINNGTINIYTTTTGTGLHAIYIWQTIASVSATFTNNGTLLMSGFEQPTVFGGSNTGSTGYGKFENTGTLTSTYPGISSGTNVGAIGIYSSGNLPNVITNSGTMNLNASFRSIYLNAKAYGGSFTNTGTINIAKGIIDCAGTSGTPSTYQTIDNNSGGKINFNYGVSAGTTAATDKVIINNNSGATINGSSTFPAYTLVTNAGSTLSPGDYIGGVSVIGKIIINTNTSGTFNLNGKVLMQVNGKTTAGTDYDQIQVTTSGSTLNVSGATLEMTVDGSYSPVDADAISLFTGATARTGNFSSVTLPSLNWSMDYATSTAAKVNYSSTASTTIASGYTVVLSNNVTTNALTINSGGTLTVNAGKQLTISTTFSNSGILNLLSDGTNGTATILTPASIGGTGATYNVQQYISSIGTTGLTARNWYISSPLSAALSSTITTATGNGLVYYDGTANWPAAPTTMVEMKGYIAKAPAQNTTINFTGGTLNTGNKSVNNLPLGFNLVGNPYPSYVDFAQATITGITNSIWYRSKKSGSYNFHTYNVTGGTGVNDGTAIIAPMQAFWIKTTSATNTFGFTNTMRSHQDQSVVANRLKAPKVSNQQLLRLQVSNGTNKDETVVYFNENAQNTIDDYDTQKMFNNITEVPEIYTQIGTEKLVINGMNAVPYDVEMPLGFSTLQANEFSITASELKNFEVGTRMILKDKLLTTETELSEGVAYNFSSQITTPTTGRFSLLFRAPASPNCLNNSAKPIAQVFVNAANQITIIAPEKATYSIYNAIGQKVNEGITTSNNQTTNHKLKTGLYIVELSINGQRETQKIIIR